VRRSIKQLCCSRGLSLNEPHGRPPHRLANRLRVRGIVLLSFDVRLHVGWRHQPNRVAKRFEFA
jgi:hypothetical protein